MATNQIVRPSRPPYAPDAYERLLAVASAVLLAMVAAAILRGRADWARVPLPVWAHLATLAVALSLTPAILLRPRGDRPHRRLGWLWAACLFATALISFLIRQANPGHLSLIHLLSAWMLGLVPLIVWSASTHRVALHRRAVRGAVSGALLIAGFFTFPFDRMLGHWLFG
ncbi:MAG: hypothetical protein ABW173_11480 [Sphingomonas sp.]